MNKVSNVASMTDTAKRCFEAANALVESMAVGDRKQLKELVAEVGSAVGLDEKKVLGFVTHFTHETNIAYVTRGKKGGLVRGVRPAKVVKEPKTKVTAAPAAPADTSDSE